MLVRWYEREFAKSYRELITKLCMHLLEDRMKHSARRTLEITKLFELDRRIR